MKKVILALLLTASSASAQTGTLECTATLKDFDYYGVRTDFQYDKRQVDLANGYYRFTYKDPANREAQAMINISETVDGLDASIGVVTLPLGTGATMSGSSTSSYSKDKVTLQHDPDAVFGFTLDCVRIN
jgi:hypothetical protein